MVTTTRRKDAVLLQADVGADQQAGVLPQAFGRIVGISLELSPSLPRYERLATDGLVILTYANGIASGRAIELKMGLYFQVDQISRNLNC